MYPLSIPGFRTFIVNGNIWPLFVRFFYSIYRDNALVFYIWQNWRIPNTHTLSLFKPIKSLLLVFAPFLFRCVWRPGGPSSHLRKNFSKNLPMICSFSYFSIYPGFFISQDLWASFDRFCSRSLTLVVFRDLTINIQCILLKWRILLRGPGSQPACLPAYLTKCSLALCLKISCSTNFMPFRNVAQRILRFFMFELLCRVAAYFFIFKNLLDDEFSLICPVKKLERLAQPVDLIAGAVRRERTGIADGIGRSISCSRP